MSDFRRFVRAGVPIPPAWVLGNEDREKLWIEYWQKELSLIQDQEAVYSEDE